MTLEQILSMTKEQIRELSESDKELVIKILTEEIEKIVKRK